MTGPPMCDTWAENPPLKNRNLGGAAMAAPYKRSSSTNMYAHQNRGCPAGSPCNYYVHSVGVQVKERISPVFSFFTISAVATFTREPYLSLEGPDLE